MRDVSQTGPAASGSGLAPNHEAAAHTAGSVASAPLRRRSRRARLLTWLRQTHLYLGLWAGVLGLLFGSTGIILNHRAILKWPVPLSHSNTIQLALPDPAAPPNPARRAATPAPATPATSSTSSAPSGQPFASPEALARWLLAHGPALAPFGLQHIDQIRREPAKNLIWNGQTQRQPERWRIRFARPGASVTAEYWVGNRFVQLEQADATPIGTLARLHMAVGVNAFWVILSDSIAASLIVLCLTGLLLWTQLHTVRTLALCTSVAALLASGWFYWLW